MKIVKGVNFSLDFRPASEQVTLMGKLTGDCELAADEAFTQIYHDYYAPLVRKASGYLKDVKAFAVATSAEDIAQEALSRLWNSRKEMDPQSARVYAWLCKVTHHLALGVLREVRNQKTELLDTSPEAMEEGPAWEPISRAPTPHQMLERSELLALIERGIDALPPRQAEAFRLRYLQELDEEVVAESMRVKRNTVKSLTHKAKLHIAKFLRAHGIDIVD